MTRLLLCCAISVAVICVALLSTAALSVAGDLSPADTTLTIRELVTLEDGSKLLAFTSINSGRRWVSVVDPNRRWYHLSNATGWDPDWEKTQQRANLRPCQENTWGYAELKRSEGELRGILQALRHHPPVRSGFAWGRSVLIFGVVVFGLTLARHLRLRRRARPPSRTPIPGSSGPDNPGDTGEDKQHRGRGNGFMAVVLAFFLATGSSASAAPPELPDSVRHQVTIEFYPLEFAEQTPRTGATLMRVLNHTTKEDHYVAFSTSEVFGIDKRDLSTWLGVWMRNPNSSSTDYWIWYAKHLPTSEQDGVTLYAALQDSYDRERRAFRILQSLQHHLQSTARDTVSGDTSLLLLVRHNAPPKSTQSDRLIRGGLERIAGLVTAARSRRAFSVTDSESPVRLPWTGVAGGLLLFASAAMEIRRRARGAPRTPPDGWHREYLARLASLVAADPLQPEDPQDRRTDHEIGGLRDLLRRKPRTFSLPTAAHPDELRRRMKERGKRIQDAASEGEVVLANWQKTATDAQAVCDAQQEIAEVQAELGIPGNALSKTPPGPEGLVNLDAETRRRRWGLLRDALAELPALEAVSALRDELRLTNIARYTSRVVDAERIEKDLFVHCKNAVHGPLLAPQVARMQNSLYRRVSRLMSTQEHGDGPDQAFRSRLREILELLLLDFNEELITPVLRGVGFLEKYLEPLLQTHPRLRIRPEVLIAFGAFLAQARVVRVKMEQLLTLVDLQKDPAVDFFLRRSGPARATADPSEAFRSLCHDFGEGVVAGVLRQHNMRASDLDCIIDIIRWGLRHHGERANDALAQENPSIVVLFQRHSFNIDDLSSPSPGADGQIFS